MFQVQLTTYTYSLVQSVPDSDSGCPAEQPGFTQTFPSFVSDLYATFVPTNSIPLQAEGGGACYPFADALQGKLPSTSYNETSLPQCQMPQNETGYCAFVFEDSNANFTDASQCQGRTYSMQTFETEDAVPANASITHKGPCGVCSNAQDLSRRMVLRDDMPKIGVLCGTKYFTSNPRSFDELIQCYQDQGFTKDCATLWSHLTATNAVLCAGLCFGAKPPYNTDPPECDLNACLSCGVPFAQAFDAIAGRTQPNSGITENIARNCSEFYAVVHDPCPGQEAPATDEAKAPTAAPSGAAPWRTSFAFVAMSLMMWGW